MQAHLTNILGRHPTDPISILDPMTSPTTQTTTVNRWINSGTIENPSQLSVVGSQSGAEAPYLPIEI